jgi:hypothetical protein
MSDDITTSQQLSRDRAIELHNEAIRQNVLLIWVVMTGTVEYGEKFVARPWNGNINMPFLHHLIADDLESIRGQLPPGRYRIPRQAGEDPVIIETWL